MMNFFRPNLIAFLLLLIVSLTSCGGGSSSPTVALSNMVPVQLAMHLPSQAVAQADLMDKVLDLAIPDANAIVLTGVTSVTVTISGNGFTTIVDSFPAGAPGTQLVKQYSVPQGAFRTFSIQGFNTPVGTPAAPPVISGATTVPTLVAGGAPVVVDVVLNPTTDRIAPVVAGPAPITVPAVNATGTPKTNAAIAVFLASATATDNVDVNPAVTNNAPLQFPLGPTTVTFTSTDLAGNVSTPVPVVVTIADQSPPVITLRGANPLSVAQGSAFVDPGSIVTDNVDVGLVAGVTGVVNTAVTGPVVLTYNVSDAAGNPAIPVQRTVIVNGPPLPTAPGIATNANTAGTSQIAPNDPNPGNTHTYAVTTQGVSGAATVNAAGLATYTPNNGFAGADSFVVTVTDQGGLTGTVTISVTVNAPPNQAPLPTAPGIVTNANTAGTSQVAPNDPNAGNTHSYAVTTQGVSGAATVNAAGLATYTPNAGFVGTDSFVVTVTDQGGLTGAVTISVTVNAPPNQAPLPTAPAIVTTTNTAGTSQIAPNDPNIRDAHTYAVTTQGVSGAATVNAAGLATYTPNAGFVGTDSFVVTVTDQGGLTGTVTISVTVNAPPPPPNQAPAPTAPAIATITNTAGTSQIAPNDPNAGDTHTYAVTTPAASGTATVDPAGLATYTPNAGSAGADSFVVTVTDNGTPQLSGTVIINVNVVVAPAAWHWLHPTPMGDDFHGVAYNGTNTYVAVGNGGVVFSSSDGITWTQQTSATTNILNEVRWGGGLFVAVGFLGTIVTSPDGMTWTLRTSGTVVTLDDVVWSGSKFVAVGDTGTVVTSSNGIAWTATQVTPSGLNQVSVTANLSGITWGGTQFVAVGSQGTILTSTNGSTWTAQTFGTIAGLDGIAWDGTTFVATGGVIATSTDAITWSSQATATWIEDVTWDGAQFVAVGGSNASSTILTSPAGTTWTPRTSVQATWTDAVAWNGKAAGAGKLLVAVGWNGGIMTSPDGVSWTSRTLIQTPDTLDSIAWDGTTFVVVGNLGAILTSTDGATWILLNPSPTAVRIEEVIWNGAQFVAVGDSATILTSPDGTTWTSRTSNAPLGTLLESVIWDGNKFVVAGWSGTILTSPDGITWTSQTSNTANNLRSITWNGKTGAGKLFVAVGSSGGTLLTSPDAVSWTTQTPITTTSLNEVIWNGSLFLTVGSTGEIWTSLDGIGWTSRTSGTPELLDGIAWSGFYFVVTGTGGTILTSPDGVTWTSQASGTTLSLSGAGWVGNSFFALGSNGAILTSP